MAWHSHVLVGYDGTNESERALKWAAREARLRRLTLTVCHAWRWPYSISHIDYEGVAIAKRMGAHILDHGVFIAETTAAGVTVRKRLMDGPAAAALLHEGHDAEMIVLGPHQHEELPVGSTGLQVPARAHRPVVVVHQRGARTDGRVVVGVDGSPGSDAALAFAFEEAALHHWEVQAVYGYREPSMVRHGELHTYADADGLRRSCGARLERTVAPWLTKYPYVKARTALVEDDPRKILLDASAGADLLVVGDRGAGGLHPLLLGATSTAVLAHGHCPIAIVHDPSVRDD